MRKMPGVVSHPRRVLVINPNTSTSVTETFQPILSELDLRDTIITYWTSPTGPPMIKSQADLYESASACLPLLLDIADDFDGFLAACYADHPLVRMLRLYIPNKPIVGIFDASIFAAIQLVGDDSTFGIVTTAADYEPLLDRGVEDLIAPDGHLARFCGTCASGIGLSDLQPDSCETASSKIISATRRLIELSGGNIDVVCMGGVILAGMEKWVHEAWRLEKSPKRTKSLKVVDQLLAGMLSLDALLDGNAFHTIDYRRALR
jgi:Asp/Glu/hydantoin racemase